MGMLIVKCILIFIGFLFFLWLVKISGKIVEVAISYKRAALAVLLANLLLAGAAAGASAVGMIWLSILGYLTIRLLVYKFTFQTTFRKAIGIDIFSHVLTFGFAVFFALLVALGAIGFFGKSMLEKWSSFIPFGKGGATLEESVQVQTVPPPATAPLQDHYRYDPDTKTLHIESAPPTDGAAPPTSEPSDNTTDNDAGTSDSTVTTPNAQEPSKPEASAVKSEFHKTAYRSVELSNIGNYVGKDIRLVTTAGLMREGKLQEVEGGVLRLEIDSSGGVMTIYQDANAISQVLIAE